MPRTARRVLPLAFAALVLIASAAPASAADMTPAQAESYVLTLLNQQRAAVGLVPLRTDSRVVNIARQRSADMAKYDYFDHRSHDGRYAWDMMSDAGITWYWSGEIIAWNSWGTLKESAEAAARGWHDSPPHYDILTSKDYNYFGAGYMYDTDSGTCHGVSPCRIWTVVFLKGPDRTGTWSRMGAYSLTTCASVANTKYLRYSWSGSDYTLQVLTAGLNYFQIQRRRNGGSWTWVTTATTTTARSGCVAKGYTWEFRVRGRDKAGNYGAWTAPIAVRP